MEVGDIVDSFLVIYICVRMIIRVFEKFYLYKMVFLFFFVVIWFCGEIVGFVIRYIRLFIVCVIWGNRGKFF